MSQSLSRSRRWASLLGLGLLLSCVGVGLAKEVEYADVNHDGEVNFLDVAQVQRCVGQNPQAWPPNGCNLSDTNKDNRVDALDLAIVTRQLGQRDYPFYIEPDPATYVEDPRGGIYPVNRVSVLLREATTRTGAEAFAASVGGQLVGFIHPGRFVLEVPTTTIAELNAVIAQLKQDPRVQVAMPSILLTLDSSLPTDLTRLRRALPDLTRAYDQILVDQAWQLIAASGIARQSVAIGIVDTGVCFSHPEFRHIAYTDLRERGLCDPANGGQGHGTQIAGIIGANDNGAGPPAMNGIVAGVPGSSGVYRLIASPSTLRALSGTKVAAESFQTYIAAVIKEGASVVNLSASGSLCGSPGNPGSPPPPNCNPMDAFLEARGLFRVLFERHPDVLFVVGAGNRGIAAADGFPGGDASIDNLLTVAATTLTEEPWSDPTAGATNVAPGVDLAAPGEQIYAPNPGGAYEENFGGTSGATAMVTGVAAMLRMLNPTLTPVQLKTILRATADPAPAAVGGRRVNACAAVQRVLRGQGLTVPPLLECSRGGLVRTGGGDAYGLAKPGDGGAVTIRAGLGVSTAVVTQPLVVPLGTKKVLAGNTTHTFTTIEIDGELEILGAQTTLAAMGPVSILGKITVRKAANDRNGGNLDLVSGGGIFLQGEINTAGGNGMAFGARPQAGGVGGALMLHTASRAAFTVPTISTRGGDAALTDARVLVTAFPGANGGAITIAARSVLLRFGGQTLDKTMVNPLPPEVTGLILPTETLFVRGLLTTGGFGGFYRGANNTLIVGSAGGDGGAIRMTCLEQTPGVRVPVRFQDTALLTGGGVDKTLGVPTFVVSRPGARPSTVLLKHTPGSLGGRGARGTNKDGGDGGTEGNGGDVTLNTVCALEPAPTQFEAMSYAVFEGEPRHQILVRRYMVHGKTATGAVLYSLQATAGSGGFPSGSTWSVGSCSNPPGPCFVDSPGSCLEVCTGVVAGHPGSWGAAGTQGAVSCNALQISATMRTIAALTCQ